VGLTDTFLMSFNSKLLETKAKKSLKSRGEKEHEFKEYLSMFYDQKIFVKRKDLPNFEKVLFFPERIETDTREKYKKYKMWKLKLD
jgi:hypothetical protein